MDDELKKQAEAAGIKVDARWSDATLREKIDAAAGGDNVTVLKPVVRHEVVEPAKPDVKMLPVRLLKHYKPSGPYRIVGEPPPPPFPGLDFKDKLWAGTVVELPRDEVLRLLENVAVSITYHRERDGSIRREKVSRRFPLAERADALPV